MEPPDPLQPPALFCPFELRVVAGPIGPSAVVAYDAMNSTLFSTWQFWAVLSRSLRR